MRMVLTHSALAAERLFGRRFGIGPWATRALFLITLIVIPGSQILVYPLLWILMPKEPTRTAQGYGPAPTYGTPPA